MRALNADPDFRRRRAEGTQRAMEEMGDDWGKSAPRINPAALNRFDLLDGIPPELSRRWSETMARHLKDDRAKRGAA